MVQDLLVKDSFNLVPWLKEHHFTYDPKDRVWFLSRAPDNYITLFGRFATDGPLRRGEWHTFLEQSFLGSSSSFSF